MNNDHDLRDKVTTNGNHSLAATPGATPTGYGVVAPAYGSVDGYGVPAHQRGLALSAGDMLSGVLVALIILGPLVAGAIRVG